MRVSSYVLQAETFRQPSESVTQVQIDIAIGVGTHSLPRFFMLWHRPFKYSLLQRNASVFILGECGSRNSTTLGFKVVPCNATRPP